MKLYLSIILCLLFINTQAQKYFKASITYKCEVDYLNKKDSLLVVDGIEKYGIEYARMFSLTLKEVHLYKKDTLVIQKIFGDEDLPHVVYIATRDSYKRLDMNAGRVRDWYTNKSKYADFKKYKRISKEDEIICAYKCEAWKATTSRGWKKVWLARVDGKLPELKEKEIVFDHKLILKDVIKFNKSKIKTKYATEINELKELNFSSLIKKNTTANLSLKYKPIDRNSNIELKVLKVGDLAPNLSYRNVFDNEISQLNTTINQSNYTMIEFWGSWCGPCLAVTNKIKKLRNKFTEQELSIISFNALDRIEEKVKAIIKKKEMNWKHAYATDKIITIFNENKRFPHAVLIDKDSKVVLTGNPHQILEKVKQIVSGEISIEE